MRYQESESRTLARLVRRFWEKVEKTDGCWLWRGARRNNRYGSFWGGNERGYVYAHRMAYELAKGPIPEGMAVCHSCDVTLCVNPDHLWLGSDQENFADMRKKRRHTFG